MAMDALRAWAQHTGIDGLRFDLATAMGRREAGFDSAAPLLTAIDQDPLLRDLKLVAEPWDIGPGGYQVGAFAPRSGSMERQVPRRCPPFLARRLGTDAASSLRAWRDRPTCSAPTARPSRNVNFITAHDGFTCRPRLLSAQAQCGQRRRQP